MGFKIPDFTAVGLDDPRSVGGLPNFPQTDPGAAGLAALGKGVQAAGTAALNIADDQKLKRDKKNDSTATLDLFTRLTPLQTKIAQETDTDKIAEYRQELGTLLQTSGQAIDNPDRLLAWKSNHARVILEANKDADTRTTLLYRNKETATTNTLLDRVSDTGARSDDPQAFEITKRGIKTHLDHLESVGSLLPEARREQEKDRLKNAVASRGYYLLGKPGRAAEGLAFLEKEGPTVLDDITLEGLRGRFKAKADEEVGRAAKERNRPGAVSVGGAIPSAIAEEAGRQNVDPKTALATAQIESAMGRNLGSRGNIFQLGKNEWSTIGGGSMGEPGTDIKNGVAWLGKTQNELANALGRQPEGWEIYLGHQQGIGGATKLLRSPNTPAGQLVPPEHIRANGGDPGAPASAFISKWRNTFNRAAAGIGSGSPTAPAEFVEKPVAIGDSIAAHLIRRAGVGGAEYNTERKPDSTAVSGYGPADVLNVIQKMPDANIKGRDILLSTGVSNNPAQIDRVAVQIAELKARGAASVTLLGVGTADRVRGANDQLSEIAAENGAAFAGPMRKVAGDGIHSSDPKDLFQQAQAARPSTGGAGAAPTSALAPPPGVPDMRAWVDRIKADASLTEEQKDIAIRGAQQDHQQAMLGHERAESNLTLAVAKGEQGSADIEAEWLAGHISAAKRTQLQLHIIEEQKKQAIRDQMILRTVSAGAGGAPLDPKSKDDRAGLNLHYDAVSKAWPAEETVDRSLAYSAQYGMVPTALQARIRGGLHSGRPELAVAAADTVSRLKNANPQLVAEIGDENDMRLATSISALTNTGVPGERAVQMAVEGMKAPKAVIEARGDEWKTLRGKDDITQKASDTNWLVKQNDTWGRDPNVPALMRQEFEDTAKAEFQMTGNLEAARRMALGNINSVWGRTRVGGDSRYMKNAPEVSYAVPNMTADQNAKWQNEQLAIDAGKARPIGAAPIAADKLRVIEYPGKIGPTGRPLYQVHVVDDKGAWDVLREPIRNSAGEVIGSEPIKWYPDFPRALEFRRQQDATQAGIERARQLRTEELERRKIIDPGQP